MTKIFLQYLSLILIILISACKSTRNSTATVTLPEVSVKSSADAANYRASNTIRHDLVHTKLDVSFDWQKSYLYGKAEITLKSHFYPLDTLWLNARGMDLHRVAILRTANDTFNIKHVYRNDSIGIQLDKVYKRNETFKVYIDYTAKPDELKDSEGSAAITDDKGLYFINPLGKDPVKPKQIWTQNETQAGSVWFPTIDSPNQRMSQEITMTVDSIYKTLSNGILIRSINNNDGTRTDTWEQKIPHAPYLVMMGVGDFAVIKDQPYKSKEVSYYVEKDYEKSAKKIFGNTPEMIQFFSDKLGVEFVWDKYSQIVVRDYVSGAMENTTAVVFGEFMQKDARELLDNTNEDVISHELFHHWFGDLVTCESWSNLPLNESFATYGEYLWNEYKYGKDEADISQNADRNAYFREAKNKQVDMIRFYYDHRDDMFDRHSYQKGGLILHMLRNYTGDEAFFAALNDYLETYKFQTVEIHQLRLSFEKITGEDLNWFFDQWFLSKGHPVIDFSYSWNETTKTASLNVKQLQDTMQVPVFRLPIDIDIYEASGKTSKRINITRTNETFSFACNSKPLLINPDADKILLSSKTDNHTEAEWIELFRKGNLFQDKLEALEALQKNLKGGTPASAVFIDALKQPNWKIRETAVRYIEPLTVSTDSSIVRQSLIYLAQKDRKASVRDIALQALGEFYKNEDFTELYKNATQDSSFEVSQTALELLTRDNKIAGMQIASTFERMQHRRYPAILAALYSEYGSDQQAEYFNRIMTDYKQAHKYGMIPVYAKFLLQCKEQNNLEQGLNNIYRAGSTADAWYVRLSATQSLIELSSRFSEKAKDDAKDKNTVMQNLYERISSLALKYAGEMKQNEKDESLLKIYNRSKN